MQHATSLDLGGLAVIAIYFGGIMLIGIAYKSFLRGRDDRADEREDYFADLRERRDLRDLHRQEWRDALRQYREGGRHD